MIQQINLYQPIFRKEQKVFSARTVATSVGAIALVLVGIYGFGLWQVQKAAKEVAAMTAQQQSQQAMVEQNGAALAATANPQQIAARSKRLEHELAERRNALDLLRGGAAGETTGFAQRIEALARQHVDGVWLERVVLAGDAHTLSLTGYSTDADQIPHYLLALSQESALAGTTFDNFLIEHRGKTEQNAVHFTASSASLVDAGKFADAESSSGEAQ
jgi:Tfp pilus assembly protein PilN